MDNNTFKGQLKRWNEDKGFGFISPEKGNRDVFIHVSALKNMNRRPVVGDIVFYQIHTDNDGKNRAVNAKIEGVATLKPRAKRKKIDKQSKNSGLYKLFLLVFLVSVGFFFYNKLTKEKDFPVISNSSLISTPEEELYSTSEVDVYKVEYNCDGRIYCSEMMSCEEATYFQRNCSGTKMDGNGDGVPCERQWCK